MILIVGKNSVLYKKIKIKKKLKLVNEISYKEIDTVDFSIYKKIIIFSVDKKSEENNLAFLKKIPLDKTIYISTTAVYSLQSGVTCFKYPKIKKACEDMVRSKGGLILRVGIIDGEIIRRAYGTVPFTPILYLSLKINRICNEEKYLDKKIDVLDCYKLLHLKNNQSKNNLVNLLYRFLGFKNFLFQYSLVAVAKLFKLEVYGYTFLASQYMSKTMQIGHGALGGMLNNYIEGNLLDVNHTILVTDRPDKVLNEHGFKKTIIGYYKNGLAKYWHGVRMDEIEKNYYKKNVPFITSRYLKRTPKYKTIYVEKLSITKGLIKILGKNSKMEDVEFVTNKLYLCCGAIENLRLLINNTKQSIKLSDHESTFIGKSNVEDLVKLGLIKKSFLFFVRGKSLRINHSYCNDILLEARPYLDSNNIKKDVYTNTTTKILFNLLSKFSMHRVNEAFYNKFGFALATKKCLLFVQVKYESCITLEIEHSKIVSIKRDRFTEDQWSKISNEVQCLINSYVRLENINSFDGQHLSCNLRLNVDAFKNNELLNMKDINVVGSPSNYELSSLHNTIDSFNYYIKNNELF